MNPVVRFLRGEMRVRVTGASVERFLNLLSHLQIEFWDIERRDELHIELSMCRKEKKRLKDIALRSFCSTEILSERGIGLLLRPLRKRPVLVLGIALVIGLSFFLQSFVWVISVEGEGTLHKEVILRELERLDIRFGSRAASIDPQLTKMQMLNAVPELSWLSVNRSGGKLTVLFTERFPEPKERLPYETGSIVASRDGIITDYSILEGMRLCKRGDTVKEGQILVSGYEDYGLYLRAVCAEAEIYARTWHAGTVVTPANLSEKRYTGRQWTQVTLLLGRKRINLCGNSGIFTTGCDKMIDVKKIAVAEYEFPVSIETATYREYECVPRAVPEEAAQELLNSSWLRLVRSQMVAGTVEKTDGSFLNDGGLYILHAQSTCNEMIARLVPIGEPYKGESNE